MASNDPALYLPVELRDPRTLPAEPQVQLGFSLPAPDRDEIGSVTGTWALAAWITPAMLLALDSFDEQMHVRLSRRLAGQLLHLGFVEEDGVDEDGPLYRVMNAGHDAAFQYPSPVEWAGQVTHHTAAYLIDECGSAGTDWQHARWACTCGDRGSAAEDLAEAHAQAAQHRAEAKATAARLTEQLAAV